MTAIDFCEVRALCLVPCGANGERPRAALAFPCGFEIAGTVHTCPKRRALLAQSCPVLPAAPSEAQI